MPELNLVDRTALFLVAAIEDPELQSRARLGESLVFRIRRSQATPTMATTHRDWPLVLDLCEPRYDHKRRGHLSLVVATKRADPLRVLWSFGTGKLDDEALGALRSACVRLGWSVDDHLLHGL